MALNTDGETLTQELKMAVKAGRNFIVSLAAKPADGYLALSKKVIPKSEDVTARKKTQKKVYRGACFKDGTTFVFETDKEVSPALTLKLKLLIKAQTAFKMKQIEFRQTTESGVAPATGEAEEHGAEGAQDAPREGEVDRGPETAPTGDTNPFTGEPVAAAASGDVNPFSGEPEQMAELTDAVTEVTTAFAARASAAASTTPSPKGKSAPRKDRLDHVVDGVFDDAAKRAKALTKWEVPTFSQKYKDATAKDKFFADLNSGVSKANEYVGYVNEAIDHYQKYGDPAALAGMSGALAGMSKVTKRLEGGLRKIKTTLEAAKNVTTFVTTAKKFVSATENMDPKDPKSVERWVSSMQGLWNAAAPFLSWLQNEKLLSAAMQGSKVAGTLAAMLPIVAAQFHVGLKALEAGLKNVNAYIARLEKWDELIDEEAYGKRKKPPVPAPPGEWKTMDEKGADATAWEDMVLRDKIASEHSNKKQEAKQEFEETVFPNLYRTKVRRQVQKEIAKTTKEFDAKAGRASKKRERFVREQENYRDQLEQVRDRIASAKEAGRSTAKLQKRETSIEGKLDVVHNEIDDHDAKTQFYFNPKSIIRLRRWKDAPRSGNMESQIAAFKYMREKGYGFPVFDRIYDDELEKQVGKASEAYAKDLEKSLAVEK